MYEGGHQQPWVSEAVAHFLFDLHGKIALDSRSLGQLIQGLGIELVVVCPSGDIVIRIRDQGRDSLDRHVHVAVAVI